MFPPAIYISFETAVHGKILVSATRAKPPEDSRGDIFNSQ